MCEDLCPSNAISFIVDDKGFWYPQVEDNKCTQCGLCYKRCPIKDPYRKVDNINPVVYSLWSKDENTRLTSTSGGAFWEFAKWFIDNKGVVVGSRYRDDWRSCEHFIVTDHIDLNELKGSKYFQSDTSGIYQQVKKYLSNNVNVLFCGTPCQNSALLSFLGKEYENLYTMDFICRSINSPKAFKSYIDELEQQYDSKVINVHLKDKEKGWQSLSSRVVFANGQISLKDKDNDKWVRGFIYNDLYTRESCFHCRYKVIPRASADLTIGDFWGIKNQKAEDLFKGISVLLINSEKGKTLFDNVRNAFIYEKHRLEDVIPGNPALLYNPTKSEKQEKFFELINSGKNFSEAVDQCTKRTDNYLILNLKKIYRKFRQAYIYFYKDQISLLKYIYYNYFNKHIIRENGAKVLPHKGAVINFDKGSKIILDSGKLEIGFNQLRGSHSETHVRLNENATWRCKNGALLFYNTVLEIKANAEFESGFFSMNGGSVIIVHKHMRFGEDVMLGRNITVYDSDFHSLYNKHYKIINIPRPVIIEDHVWLTTNIMVQKGVTIGKDSLIAAYTVINKDVPPHSIVGGNATGEVIRDWVHWDRKLCPMNLDEIT